MSPSEAAASPGRGDGAGIGTSNWNDETNPAGFAVDADEAPADRLTKAERAEAEGRDAGQEAGVSDPWAPNERRDTSRADAAATTAYAATPGYAVAGSLGAGGSYAEPAAPTPAAPAGPSPARAGMARRARLKVSHLGPMSVFRISLTFSLCMFIVILVAVAALWAVLDTSGVFKSIADAANTLTDKNSNSVTSWLGFGRVMLIAVVLGAANVIAFTLLSTIGALLYNLCSDFVGGVEVTLVER